jgi:hypothetical protein
MAALKRTGICIDGHGANPTWGLLHRISTQSNTSVKELTAPAFEWRPNVNKRSFQSGSACIDGKLELQRRTAVHN